MSNPGIVRGEYKPNLRVLEPGNVIEKKESRPAWPQALCDRCQCLFEYDPKDLVWTGMGEAEWQAIPCPNTTCNKLVGVGPTY